MVAGAMPPHRGVPSIAVAVTQPSTEVVRYCPPSWPSPARGKGPKREGGTRGAARCVDAAAWLSNSAVALWVPSPHAGEGQDGGGYPLHTSCQSPNECATT